mgnify:CR=1 FL=1
MAKIKVNKSEAARRQIDVAIRILFRNEDPVAIHTLAMAHLEYCETWLQSVMIAI